MLVFHLFITTLLTESHQIHALLCIKIQIESLQMQM